MQLFFNKITSFLILELLNSFHVLNLRKLSHLYIYIYKLIYLYINDVVFAMIDIPAMPQVLAFQFQLGIISPL